MLRAIKSKLSYLALVFKAAKEKAAEDHALSIEMQEKANIARVFNDRYTYRREYKSTGEFFPQTFCRTGYAWMCPDCNTIHRPTEHNGLTGLHYPGCCKSHAGHKLYADIKSSR